MPASAESVPLFEGADKVVHAIMFGVLAAVFVWDENRGRGVERLNARKLLKAVGLSAVYGGVIELAQESMGAGRSGDWLDWLADVAGAVVAVVLCYFVVKIIMGRKRVRIVKINKLCGKRAEWFKELYETSFPAEERREWGKIVRFAEEASHPLSFYEILWKGKAAGFLTAWDLPDGWMYVEHFVVAEPLRGKGIGEQAIRLFCASHSKVVLEVELPSMGKTAQRRIAFYERCGFAPHEDFEYIQPSYGEGLPEVEMMLMTYGENRAGLYEIASLLKRIVYEKV